MITSETRSQAFTELEATPRGKWELRHTAITDVGRRREVNEDFYLIHPERALYVVADGMGGHAAGEVAARMTCETLAAYFDETELPDSIPGPDDKPLENHLVQAIKIANATVFEQASQRSDRRGMGTTVVALTFHDDRAFWAHVGDSRLYRLRKGDLQPLTKDHSLLEKTLERQDLSTAEAEELIENFPYKNVLTRAVGSRYVVDVDVGSIPVEEGDLFVMTTDGVHDVIGSNRLFDLLYLHRGDWPEACRSIVAEANRVGGPDNITVACVEVARR